MLWDLGVQCWLVVLQLTARPSHFAATKNRSLWTDLAGSRWWTVIGKRSNDYWYSKKGQWLVWRLEEMCKCNHVRLRAHGFLFPVFESRHETVNEMTLKSREPPILVWLCNTMVSCNFLLPGHLREKKLRQSMRDGQARHGSWRGGVAASRRQSQVRWQELSSGHWQHGTPRSLLWIRHYLMAWWEWLPSGPRDSGIAEAKPCRWPQIGDANPDNARLQPQFRTPVVQKKGSVESLPHLDPSNFRNAPKPKTSRNSRSFMVFHVWCL